MILLGKHGSRYLYIRLAYRKRLVAFCKQFALERGIANDRTFREHMRT